MGGGGKGRVVLVVRVVQREDVAVVIEDLIHEVAQTFGPQLVRTLHRERRNMIELQLLPRYEHRLDGVMSGYVKLLLLGEVVSCRLE
jgi:hypothetical protein